MKKFYIKEMMMTVIVKEKEIVFVDGHKAIDTDSEYYSLYTTIVNTLYPKWNLYITYIQHLLNDRNI